MPKSFSPDTVNMFLQSIIHGGVVLFVCDQETVLIEEKISPLPYMWAVNGMNRLVVTDEMVEFEK